MYIEGKTLPVATAAEQYPFVESVAVLKADGFVRIANVKNGVFFRKDLTGETAKVYNGGQIVIVGDGLMSALAQAIRAELDLIVRQADKVLA